MTTGMELLMRSGKTIGEVLAEKDAEIERLRRELVESVMGKERAIAERLIAESALEDKHRLVRELDVIWNGEGGAAQQASLCDMVAQIAKELPALRAALAEAQKDAASESRWATHYARHHDLLRNALVDVVEAYRNKHSPQHRASTLCNAASIIAAIDAARGK